MHHHRKKIAGIWLLWLCALITGCRTEEAFPSLGDYDLYNPTIVRLRSDLDEISGVVFYPKDKSIFAINDELGVLYKIYIKDKVKIYQWKFSEGADYEDLVMIDSVFFALHSDGSLTRFGFNKDSIWGEEHQIPIRGPNEFETIYYDSTENKLVLICKDCRSDNKSKTSAYAFDPATLQYLKEPVFEIDAEEIARRLRIKKTKFKPSAAAIHPITKELYVVSAVNGTLVIMETDGKIKRVVPLNPKLFKQPEGLAFTPQGHMIITNEAADIGAANILIYKYKPAVNEKN